MLTDNTSYIDIAYKNEYPAGALSNFAAYDFIIDGVECASMEGFLQSLKYRKITKQQKICKLIGKDAKKAGSKKKLWKLTQNLWWKGRKIKRYSDDFQLLIDRAYAELSRNDRFIEALRATGRDTILLHSIGSHDLRKTVLTEYEFVSRLMRIRSRIMEG